MMRAHLAARVLFATLLAIALPLSAGEFRYAIPDGWLDILHTYDARTQQSRNTDNVPMPLIKDALSGRFAMMAVDPANTTGTRAGTTVNAVEIPTTGKIKPDDIRQYAEALIGQIRAAGYTADLIDHTARKINGVTTGVATLDVTGNEGPRRMRQYLIPGRKGSTVMTFAAPKDQFERNLPTFEASVASTQGAFDHGGYDWKRGVTVFVIAGGASAAAYVFITLMRRRRDLRALADDDGPAAPPPTARPAARKPASKYTWQCEACGNPVPMRLEECRCGGKKPAA